MDAIDFTIDYNGKERTYQASYRKYGYTYRIQVIIEGIPVDFEPDEEGNFRAIINEQERHLYKDIDTRLIQSIAEELQEALK